MNILFDFISLQNYHNGGEEYTRKILNYILKLNNIKVFGLYDSKLKFLDNDYKEYSNLLRFINIQEMSISQIIEYYKIDLFYIGIAQRYSRYDLNNIYCRTICTIHDIGDIEVSQNNINLFYKYKASKNIKAFIKSILPKFIFDTKKQILKSYMNLRTFITKNNVEIITVSEYTKNSLIYFFPELINKEINVYYPPVKEYAVKKDFEDETLKAIMHNKKRYLLFLNADRENKNFNIFEKCIPQILKTYTDLYIVITNMQQPVTNNRIIGLGYVSNSDIENLYKYAWALIYPSFTEGFGYPPIEAMKYSIPTICANVCSMPEILGDASIYFSPFYENDLFYKIKYLTENYDVNKLKLKKQYEKIKTKQETDFSNLIYKIHS